MNQNEQYAGQGLDLSLAKAAPKGQLIPAMQIEALPGGFTVTVLVQGNYGGTRRMLVPNLDALTSTVQRWANEASAATER